MKGQATIETQATATPKNLSDPELLEWVKNEKNPLISPPIQVSNNSFRDPTTAWKTKNGKWNMLLGSSYQNEASILLYESLDFVKWDFKKIFYRQNFFGSQVPECPDFFNEGLFYSNGTVVSSSFYVLKVILFLFLNFYFHF